MTLKMKDVLNVKAKDFPLADPKHWEELGNTRNGADELTRMLGERIKSVESASESAARSSARFGEAAVD